MQLHARANVLYVMPISNLFRIILSLQQDTVDISGLDKVAASFGLVVNYKKGKTMAMLKFYPPINIPVNGHN